MENKVMYYAIKNLKKCLLLLTIIAGFLCLSIGRVNGETGAELLILNNNKYDVNIIKFKQIEYVGQCAGVIISPEIVNAKFNYPPIPPGVNTRVIIKNVTKGIDGNPYPYTDREYGNNNRYSQSFDIKINSSHKESTFSVLEGENQLEFTIKDDNKVIAQGLFNLQVSIQDLGVFSHNKTCYEEVECREEYNEYYDNDGKNRGNRRRINRQVCYPVHKCYCR